MSEISKIEWTDATWNPWHGCHKVSPGCKLCYMFREKKQYGQDPNVVVRSKTTFTDPLKWKEPRLVFTCSWSDWFIEEADAWRDEAYDIIRRTPHLTYQILTKRPERMAGRVPDPPLPNIWFGVSAEDQPRADERIVELLKTPAAVRFLSVEPLLRPVDLREIAVNMAETIRECVAMRQARGEIVTPESIANYPPTMPMDSLTGWSPGGNLGSHLDWVIVGGESGPGARPMHPDWARSVRDQCVEAGVPFFFKQWGEFQHGSKEWGGPRDYVALNDGRYCKEENLGAFLDRNPDTHNHWQEFRPEAMARVGKKTAGRLLDGREWNEMPARGRA